MPPSPLSASRRTVASLFRQNARLRASLDREFERLDALPAAYPSFHLAMRSYQRSLAAAAAANDRALAALYGAPSPRLHDALLEHLSPPAAYDGLGAVWRQLANEWTGEGSVSLGALRRRLCGLAAAHSPASVLVPGCGMARLAWELARALPHARVLALDASEAQVGAARAMLRCAAPAAVRFHPFLDEPRNALHARGRAAALDAPDVAPAAEGGGLRLERADFFEWARGAPPQVECVVTCFFLDCLQDPVAAVEAVRDALAPGGLWLFAGPLAYHHWPQLSPPVEHLLTLAAEVGLPPVGAPELIHAPYVGAPGILRHDADYTAAVWACRKA
ncbi:hypothetical protein AB1Y20_003465 [Prymnesium parvum]|uniref:carnosine N-methyltransferase n=1 Tax=Prymnesium parvum TaxID=97485 RepID=A0AB34JE92_PRYPA